MNNSKYLMLRRLQVNHDKRFSDFIPEIKFVSYKLG